MLDQQDKQEICKLPKTGKVKQANDVLRTQSTQGHWKLKTMQQ